MEIRLLGPLSVSRNGTSLELTGPKRRALLSLLAINVGTPVGRDRITDALWPAPHTGREDSTLRVHVSHLRDVLEPSRDDAPTVLVTNGSGYMLSDSAVTVDTARFVDLVERSREVADTDPEAALEMLGTALEMWRGRPLQDVEYEEFAQEEIRHLEKVRSTAIEERAVALIALDRDAAAVGDLESLVRTEPARERPVTLLMTALYRTGRHADSLRVARRHARALADQGLEPSPRVTQLETRILNHDPDLLPPGSVAPTDIVPGYSVRGYEIREEAGSGSVGVVFRAFQPSVGRDVAIKVIDPEVADRPEFVRRFTEEARVVASLEHPHIVPLHDFWREPNGAFLVMRWMDGGSLRDRSGTPMPTRDVLEVFGQLADALEYAHSAGVIHRDVRPENVLFDASGNAYLCDFGLAVVIGDSRVDAGSWNEVPYASPELTQSEGATVASDIYGLGVLLTEAATGLPFDVGRKVLDPALHEIVHVATAANPADRYPDVAALAAALRSVVGSEPIAPSRRVRRNPYKGLAAFDEGDRADFYGRDDVIDTLLDLIHTNGLTTVIGASGSGKSSVVMAGVLPQLREGALPGSDEWSIVTMVPGTDPFDEFHTGLRSAAVGHIVDAPRDASRELREAFAAALAGPNSRALLVVDQFEELFSSEIDESTRERFLDNLFDLAADPTHRVRVVLTLRADFSDRPLGHPRFGDLMARATVLIAPMRPEQVEDVIRMPAARVGVEIEPGLVAEIVRDVASATAFLPLLQYALAELFEQRTSDRLEVHTYRALGGVTGVIERTAEETYRSLTQTGRSACRQLFLRMVQLGDHGEETRRRLPLTELDGLGARVDVEKALKRFSEARLLTFDRDPVTRTPTVEVAHETVMAKWVRYRVWIDEARTDIHTHRRISVSAETWSRSEEDPEYLLVGGPLAAARVLQDSGGIVLNELETRFVTESTQAREAADEREAARLHEEQALAGRSRRRLAIGIGAVVVALVVGVLAAFALVQRQRAEDLAASQERTSTARGLASASVSSLDAADPQLSLLLAIESAQISVDADEPILPETVDALHRSIVTPRPAMILEGAGSASNGRALRYSRDGSILAMLNEAGGITIVDAPSGSELATLPAQGSSPIGIDLHPDGTHVLLMTEDSLYEWDWVTGASTATVPIEGTMTTAEYSRDGSLVAVGRSDGVVEIREWPSFNVAQQWAGHEGAVNSLSFDPTGARIVTGGLNFRVIVWDTTTGEALAEDLTGLVILPVLQVAWNPTSNTIAVTTQQGIKYLMDSETGLRIHVFGNAADRGQAASFSAEGSLLATADDDGFIRTYGTLTGGEAMFVLPTGGVPLRDVEWDPNALALASLGVDGKVRIWRDLSASELPARDTPVLYPRMASSSDGARYVESANAMRFGSDPSLSPTTVVIDSMTGETILSVPSLLAFIGFGGTAITADGSRVVTTDAEGSVSIYDVDTGQRYLLADDLRWAMAFTFSDDGELLAGAGPDGSIAVWDAATQEQVALLEGHGDREPANRSVPRERGADGPGLLTTYQVRDIAFVPGTHRMISAGFDGTIRSWNVETGEGTVLYQADFEITSLSVSRDGESIATSDRSGKIVIIDAETGALVSTLEPLSGATRLTFSPDGSVLGGAGPGPFAFLWDVETARITRRFEGAIFEPADVAFVNDGTELRVASAEGINRGYALDPLDLLEIAKGLVSRSLTDDECERYAGVPCTT